jgi:hypothetical protein
VTTRYGTPTISYLHSTFYAPAHYAQIALSPGPIGLGVGGRKSSCANGWLLASVSEYKATLLSYVVLLMFQYIGQKEQGVGEWNNLLLLLSFYIPPKRHSRDT